MSRTFAAQFDYTDSDKYIRAIKELDICYDGEISAAAFKRGSGGCSVTRSDIVHMPDALDYMHTALKGKMATFPVTACTEAEIFEKYSPSNDNKNHWELFRNEKEQPLTDSQITILIEQIEFAD